MRSITARTIFVHSRLCLSEEDVVPGTRGPWNAALHL